MRNWKKINIPRACVFCSVLFLAYFLAVGNVFNHLKTFPAVASIFITGITGITTKKSRILVESDGFEFQTNRQFIEYMRRTKQIASFSRSLSAPNETRLYVLHVFNCTTYAFVTVARETECRKVGPRKTGTSGPSCRLPGRVDAWRIEASVDESILAVAHPSHTRFTSSAGGSYIRVEIFSGDSDVNVCVVSDHFNGSYSIECPPSGASGVVELRVMLMHVHFQQFYESQASRPRCFLLFTGLIRLRRHPHFSGWVNRQFYLENGNPVGRRFNRSCLIANSPIILVGASHMRYVTYYLARFLNVSTRTFRGRRKTNMKDIYSYSRQLIHLALKYSTQTGGLLGELVRIFRPDQETVQATDQVTVHTTAQPTILVQTGSHELSTNFHDLSSIVTEALAKLVEFLLQLRAAVPTNARIIYVSPPAFPHYHYNRNRNLRNNAAIAVHVYNYKLVVSKLAESSGIEWLDVFTCTNGASSLHAQPGGHFIEGSTHYGRDVKFTEEGEVLAHLIAGKICRAI